MAVAGNWVVENCSTVGTGPLVLTGPLTGFVSFSNIVADTESVYYSIEEVNGDREAGIGTYNSAGNSITRDNIGATLKSSVYDKDSPTAITLTGGAIVGCVTIAGALNEKESLDNKAVAGGYASLDGDGLVPLEQLPASTNNVLEYADFASLPASGSAGILYITLDNNNMYRWETSAYEFVTSLITTNLTEGTNLFYTEVRVSANASVTANTSKVSNVTHTGEVTGDTLLTIIDDAVTYAKMQNVVADNVILGNNAGAGGVVDELTATEVRTIINVADGADVTDSTSVDAAGAVMESHISATPSGSIIDDDTMASASNTTLATSESIKAYVDTTIVSSVTYEGSYDATTNTPALEGTPSINTGSMYTVTVAGTFYTHDLEVGDVLISENVDPTTLAEWTIVNKDLDSASIKTSYESNADTNAYTDAEVTKVANLSNINSGDQTSIVGITGTVAEFNTAITDATLSGDNTGDEPDASDTVAGIVELADITETNTGTSTTLAITPDGLEGSKFGTSSLIETITFIIEGYGSEITAGVSGYLEIPFACTINQVTLLADVSGSIVVDIWKDTYANYPPTDADTITASAVPTITTALKSQDATLTGWTTTIAAGDILGFNVDSITTCTKVTLSLKITRT